MTGMEKEYWEWFQEELKRLRREHRQHPTNRLVEGAVLQMEFVYQKAKQNGVIQ